MCEPTCVTGGGCGGDQGLRACQLSRAFNPKALLGDRLRWNRGQQCGSLFEGHNIDSDPEFALSMIGRRLVFSPYKYCCECY